jgi:ORF6N domain
MGKTRSTTVYVETLILVLRGQRVLLDSDLARIYGVSTKALNQAIKRNSARFPEDFVFRLRLPERDQVVTNCDHLKGLKFSHSLPYVFTEYGAIMVANVLNSPKAVEMSVFVVRAFVRMREKFAANQVLEKRLAEIERKLLLHDSSLRDLYNRIRPLLLPPPEPVKRKIGFTAEENRAPYRAGKVKGKNA